MPSKKTSGAKTKKDNSETQLQVIHSPQIEETIQTPTSLMSQAIKAGSSIETIERLMNLEERWRAAGARREFFKALSKFQKEVPQIVKGKSADYGAGKAKYNYAALGDITDKIKQATFDAGLSFRWEIKDVTDNGKTRIVVTCLVSHNDGHVESTTMEASLDNSGNKNEIQQRGSTITYLRRYTLVGALGISTDDVDNDTQDKKAKETVTPKILDETASRNLLNATKKVVDATKTSVEIKVNAPTWIENLMKGGVMPQHIEELKTYVNEQFKERQEKNSQTKKEN